MTIKEMYIDANTKALTSMYEHLTRGWMDQLTSETESVISNNIVFLMQQNHELRREREVKLL